MLLLAGIASHSLQSNSNDEDEMQAAEKDLFVAADDCVTQRCSRNLFL
jgi:hypothetical protein